MVASNVCSFGATGLFLFRIESLDELDAKEYRDGFLYFEYVISGTGGAESVLVLGEALADVPYVVTLKRETSLG